MMDLFQLRAINRIADAGAAFDREACVVYMQQP